MTTSKTLASTNAAPVIRTYPAASLRFDWAAAALDLWLIGGLYLDGWAHRHGRVDTSFFTPWHAVLYSGATVLMIFLALAMGRWLARGHTWRHALPAGYLLALIGAGLFALGGLLDMTWHTLFGVEVDLEALLSPSHLLLAFSGVFMITGPLRAAWVRPAAAKGWPALGPLVFSTLALLSIFTFFTTYAHPFDYNLASAWEAERPVWLSQSLGLSALLLQAALLSALVLLLVRRFTLPFGALTVIAGGNSLLMAVFQDRYELAFAAVIAAFLADILYAILRPSAANRIAFYTFAAALPMLLSGSYMVAVGLTNGLAWTMPLWTGAIVLTGFTGLLLAALLTASAAPPTAST